MYPPPAPLPPTSTKRRLKRVAPLQLGIVLAILYGIMGILFLPFFFVITMVSEALPPEQRAGMMAFGLGFSIMMPVMYAAMGFVFGVLGAALYNLIAKWVGGIEVEVE